MPYFFYLLASRPKGTLYAGSTTNLVRRIYEHKHGLIPGFTSRYKVDRLVYYEIYEHLLHAVQRERNVKHWPRTWKIALIEKDNPHWDDLYEKVL